ENHPGLTNFLNPCLRQEVTMLWRACCAVCAFFLVTAITGAQEFRATLTGRVTDPQNLTIAEATVQVRNVSTGEVSSANTDSHGNFSIPFLRPGTYTVTVLHTGFLQFTQQGVTLEVAQIAFLPIQLHLGAETESVIVTAEAPLLETATADRGGVVDTQRVSELPLNARNPFMLGGIMNVVLKSGGNKFHGSAWEFMRRTWLDANTFQNNSKGAPRAIHYLDQYGGQIEGPVLFPKLYNGHDKTFFLFSIENYREGTPSPLLLSVPAPEFLNGDFSKLVDANGKTITIFNQFTF